MVQIHPGAVAKQNRSILCEFSRICHFAAFADHSQDFTTFAGFPTNTNGGVDDPTPPCSLPSAGFQPFAVCGPPFSSELVNQTRFAVPFPGRARACSDCGGANGTLSPRSPSPLAPHAAHPPSPARSRAPQTTLCATAHHRISDFTFAAPRTTKRHKPRLRVCAFTHSIVAARSR
jgi:hypothetical protein